MLRLICLLTGLAATVTGSCVAPFKEVGEGCYYFSIEDDLKLTWTEARQYCQSLGDEVDLAVLDYLCDDFRNLGNYLLVAETFFNFGLTWVGATGGDYIWFWVDGRSLSLSSSFWYIGASFEDSGCVVMSGYTTSIDATIRRSILNVLNCTTIQPFICQDNMAY